MNMKDYYNPKLLKAVTPTTINDFMAKFDAERRTVKKAKLPISVADFGYESPIVIDHLIENIAEEASKDIDKPIAVVHPGMFRVGQE